MMQPYEKEDQTPKRNRRYLPSKAKKAQIPMETMEQNLFDKLQKKKYSVTALCDELKDYGIKYEKPFIVFEPLKINIPIPSDTFRMTRKTFMEHMLFQIHSQGIDRGKEKKQSELQKIIGLSNKPY